MEKIIHIEGMGCSGCENRVKKALEALPQVAQAQVSKNSKTAKVTLMRRWRTPSLQIPLPAAGSTP